MQVMHTNCDGTPIVIITLTEDEDARMFKPLPDQADDTQDIRPAS